MKDPDIEQGLQSLRELRGRLEQWMQSGPYETKSARIGGITAEASLAHGLTSLEIDHYWLQTTDLAEVASCTVQAVTAAEDSCRTTLWENLEGFRVGDFSGVEVADPERRDTLLRNPTSFFESLSSGSNENAGRSQES